MADQMKATPRRPILGLFSDLVNLPLQYMSAPERTQQSQGVAQFLYGTGIPKTLERASYGDSLFSGAGGLGGTTRMRPETAEALLNVAPFAPVAGRVAGRMIKATEGMPVGMGIKPINLNKGIYKPELTMEEMLKVKDIPTVDRVKQSIDLVGEKEFEKMVNAQYKKYKPSDVDQEAMLVESVTLDILGKAQRSPYPQQAALDLAQQRAALPVEQGGLGLPANNTAADRAKAMGFDVETSYIHSTSNPFTKINEDGKFSGIFTLPNYSANYGTLNMPLVARGEIATSDDLRRLVKKPTKKMQMAIDERIPDNVDIADATVEMQKLRNELARKYGFSGVKVSDEFGQDTTALVNPANIRSRFAAFDPFRKDVATAAAMGVAAPNLLAQPVNQYEPTYETIPMYTDPFGNTIGSSIR